MRSTWRLHFASAPKSSTTVDFVMHLKWENGALGANMSGMDCALLFHLFPTLTSFFLGIEDVHATTIPAITFVVCHIMRLNVQ